MTELDTWGSFEREIEALPSGLIDDCLDGTIDLEGINPQNGPTVPGYAVLGELGRGGMGVVYRAKHLALKRVVALKTILAGFHAGVNDLARFRSEAQAVARLQHPNIVQIHEIGENNGLPYLALEFVEGGSLDKKLAERTLTSQEAAALVETLARAMATAHVVGLIHRDLNSTVPLFQGLRVFWWVLFTVLGACRSGFSAGGTPHPGSRTPASGWHGSCC